MEQLPKKEIIKRIEEEIHKTQDSIVKLKEISKPVEPDDAIGRVTRMDAINNKSVAESSLRKNQEKLKQLEYMHNHADDPEFGLCAKCKIVIPLGRILLLPQSRFCVRCAN